MREYTAEWLERYLVEIEGAIKSQMERDNMFTVSVLQDCYQMVDELKDYKDLEEQGKLLNKWIPCSERMPEVEQDVLLSFRSFDVRVGYRSNNEGFFYVYGEEYVSFENTLAWQPLPEPYKAHDI